MGVDHSCSAIDFSHFRVMVALRTWVQAQDLDSQASNSGVFWLLARQLKHRIMYKWCSCMMISSIQDFLYYFYPLTNIMTYRMYIRKHIFSNLKIPIPTGTWHAIITNPETAVLHLHLEYFFITSRWSPKMRDDLVSASALCRQYIRSISFGLSLFPMARLRICAFFNILSHSSFDFLSLNKVGRYMYLLVRFRAFLHFNRFIYQLLQSIPLLAQLNGLKRRTNKLKFFFTYWLVDAY
jgi:hypothetical protein